MKILVVDDDKEIVELLSIYIKNEGYDPVTANSGQEALDQLAAHSDIALMVLDIMMPGIDGIEVVKRVRKTPRFRLLSFPPKRLIWIRFKVLSQVLMIM